MSSPEVAMVFAAGLGERMLPLSERLPKPALPVLGRPVIASALALATKAGCSRIVVNTFHLAEKMQEAVAECIPERVELRFSTESVRLETAGGLGLARDRGLLDGSGPVLVINGDALYGLDLEGLLSTEIGSDEAAMALLPHLDPMRWTRVILDSDQRLAAFRAAGEPRPGEVPYLYPGVMLLGRSALGELAPVHAGLRPALLDQMVEEQRVHGVVGAGVFHEIGTPKNLLSANLNRLSGNAWVHPAAMVHPAARLGRAVVGAGCKIGAGAVVVESLLAEGTVVGPAAQVVRSILFGVEVEATGKRIEAIEAG